MAQMTVTLSTPRDTFDITEETKQVGLPRVGDIIYPQRGGTQIVTKVVFSYSSGSVTVHTDDKFGE